MPRATSLAEVWTNEEKDVWRLPDDLTPSEWADDYRRLEPKFSNEAGQWRTARTPYLREIMDSLAEPLVERITVQKATQIGGTELLLNVVGFIIDQAPGPLLYVMPTEDDATGIAGERLRALINETPQVTRHTTSRLNDLRGRFLMLDQMVMRLAWPTASKLASLPCRYVVIDEVDKIDKFTGKEANPITLAWDRTDTFKTSRKLLVISTPTTEDGHVHSEFEASDKRHYWVPCPHCHRYQPLVWGGKGKGPGVKWPEEERNSHVIRIQKLAWYECRHCAEKIFEGHKPKMLERGVWCPAGSDENPCRVGPDGKVKGTPPVTTHRGYHISSLYSPWLDWSELVAEWLEVRKDISKLQNFANSRLAEVWREVQQETKSDQIGTLELPYEEGTVPADAVFLTAAIDVQKDHVWYSVRAWGLGGTNWLVDRGKVERLLVPPPDGSDFDPWQRVIDEILNAEYPREDTGEMMRPRGISIDSGAFTVDVYDFCRRFPEILRPIKGSNKALSSGFFRASRQDKDQQGRGIAGGLILWWLDVDHYKLKVQAAMTAAPGMRGRFYVFEGVDEEYKLQVTAEERVIIRNRKTGAQRYEWRTKKGRQANHYWDCEVYNYATADMLGVSHLTQEHLEVARRGPRPPEPPDESGRKSGWFEDRGGRWMGR